MSCVWVRIRTKFAYTFIVAHWVETISCLMKVDEWKYVYLELLWNLLVNFRMNILCFCCIDSFFFILVFTSFRSLIKILGPVNDRRDLFTRKTLPSTLKKKEVTVKKRVAILTWTSIFSYPFSPPKSTIFFFRHYSFILWRFWPSQHIISTYYDPGCS